MPIPGFYMGGACELCSADFKAQLARAREAQRSELPASEDVGHEEHPIVQTGAAPTCPHCGAVMLV